ncbi:LysR substrate-binding domain-containing protein [Pseudomonas cannabina]|uniref:LysR family transcriptional regulator n=3 Tax=Pseudomonas syringae group TaxID=136849 RepID=A0A8T8C0L4_PSEYM|nr:MULTISPECIES: LysR substrate-binding domain-containing protein [Pseudomonas syringae group]KPB77335.1 LysR family transcriptional regulator [Pseudomonas syringae pv. maculicola]KPW25088.1 LysR family transcriptional regulator [Pseudomonas cannabina pv. alisalensis]MBM0140456.1 LysR family transcriptional regulator [Pseudomonas cannabina pv. alisalensis]QHE97101.1 LysR family transcriptional regulator [Pseudomonas syringae pv. maculicola str. ES4326]QQN19820.1 LysR family transcriptional reg
MNYPNLDDLNVFIHVARRSSFVGAANELGMSAAYVSKRVKLLEQNLGVVLLHRSTRQVSITEDGERIYEWAKGILESVQQMGDEVAALHGEPSGLLRVVSSQGFGRRFVAPALSELAARYPKLDIRLDIQDRLVDLIEEGVDLDIRVGNQIAPHLRARHLARNWRVLCASPAYLQRQGTPVNPGELANHDCLVIKERDRPFGIWHLHGPQGAETVKVTGSLSTNHGEIARQWCLDGRGLLLRSLWDVRTDLAEGRLIQVLPKYWQDADIWAVHTSPLMSSAKMRVTVEFLRDYFAVHHAPV